MPVNHERSQPVTQAQHEQVIEALKSNEETHHAIIERLVRFEERHEQMHEHLARMCQRLDKHYKEEHVAFDELIDELRAGKLALKWIGLVIAAAAAVLAGGAWVLEHLHIGLRK